MRTRIRKTETLLLAALLCCMPVQAATEDPAVSAKTAILLEAESGVSLYEKAADQPMKAASTLKLLTALTALEVLSPEQTVTIPAECCSREGSSMYLQPEENYTVRELLLGLLLASGNDAAAALACAASGSEQDFVRRMNEKASELGMTHSVFTDASGLNAEGHSTTARDLGILACAALQDPVIREVMGTQSAEVHGQTLVNHNKLLWRSEGTFGGKTGYTVAAGRTLISCTEREGMTLVCVTMDAPDDWNDHLNLLSWCYGRYCLFDAAELNWSVPLISGKTETVRLSAGELKHPVPKDTLPEIRLDMPRFLYAPMSAGVQVGKLQLLDGQGRLLGETGIFCAETGSLDETQALNFWEQLRWYWYFACRHSISYPQYAFY